ncbi:MAG: DUF3795 domain-containing protein [Methanomassiliicoccales archaeon]|nr:DUF3795 domain-containing protein [Methanomassiliicoccales archaeon]NYT15893.1 DUF3795 domain-containing protein [Methanomassiliicoccales archaeon]
MNESFSSEGASVAYGDLHCGGCFFHSDVITDLARDLRKEFRQSRFDLTAKVLAESGFLRVFSDYETCYEVLEDMVKLRCKKGCREGGGSPQCKIRKCCQMKDIRGCWECGHFESCEKLDFLWRNHGEAHIINLRRLKRMRIGEFIEGKHDWYVIEKKTV